MTAVARRCTEHAHLKREQEHRSGDPGRTRGIVAMRNEAANATRYTHPPLSTSSRYCQ